jgi:hypothetical protein
MVTSPKGLWPKNDCAGEDHQHIQKTDPSSRQRGRPRIGLDTKTYWLTDLQSQSDFDFDKRLLYILTRDVLLMIESGKGQTRPLVRESAPHQQACNCLRVIKSGRRPQMGTLFQDRLADWTVGRNITLTLGLTFLKFTGVEAGSNTSTVTLRVIGGDEKGSLRSETVKYGHESRGTRTHTKNYWLTDRQSQCDFDFSRRQSEK